MLAPKALMYQSYAGYNLHFPFCDYCLQYKNACMVGFWSGSQVQELRCRIIQHLAATCGHFSPFIHGPQASAVALALEGRKWPASGFRRVQVGATYRVKFVPASVWCMFLVHSTTARLG